MDLKIWIVLGLAILLVVFFIINLFLDKKKRIKTKPDYYNFFITGIIWFVVGIFLGFFSNNWILFIMGVVFILIGMIHKKDWKKNHRFWKDLIKKKI